MRDPALLDRAHERAGDMLLPDDIGKLPRPPFAR
jgi:hypothetical protein